MWNYRTGDLIAHRHPTEDKPLKIGLIICDDEESFTIKWTSFDKVFFMEKEGDIFAELNKTFLLSTVRFYREKEESSLFLLNSMYLCGQRQYQRIEKNNKTNC
jgi:hypothetical protein